MPWSKKNVPKSAEHLKGHERDIFVAAANSALGEYKDDVRAIRTGFHAVAMYRKGKGKPATAAEVKKDKGKGVKDVSKSTDDSLLDKMTRAFREAFEKVFSETEAPPTVEVTKSLDIEERRALFVVLEPDIVDLHGDTYSAEEVEKACINFNTHCNTANIFHRAQTEDVKIEQSFINHSFFVLDDGREIKKGSWLQWWYFPDDNANSELLWKMVKEGEIQGVSIGATAMVEEIE